MTCTIITSQYAAGHFHIRLHLTPILLVRVYKALMLSCCTLLVCAASAWLIRISKRQPYRTGPAELVIGVIDYDEDDQQITRAAAAAAAAVMAAAAAAV